MRYAYATIDGALWRVYRLQPRAVRAGAKMRAHISAMMRGEIFYVTVLRVDVPPDAARGGATLQLAQSSDGGQRVERLWRHVVMMSTPGARLNAQPPPCEFTA